ncbi:MAG TPA: hypothetical protein VGM79_33580 [Streptosporangiaceae bacterium]|jgi:hypothetical protein
MTGGSLGENRREGRGPHADQQPAGVPVIQPGQRLLVTAPDGAQQAGVVEIGGVIGGHTTVCRSGWIFGFPGRGHFAAQL